MPNFECQTCGKSFTIPDSALAKYPGWTPRYCREHSPKKRGGSGGGKAGGGGRGRNFAREENLTTAQVLEKYHDGPQDGLFTDGSAHPNPGRGGWGVVWVEGGEIREQRHGEEAETTNNRMELRALIAAYELLEEDAAATIYTDSKLCVDTITKWAASWERMGWKRKKGPVLNLDLVKELYALHRAHPRCELKWIAAHSGNRWNEYADSLASAWQRDEV